MGSLSTCLQAAGEFLSAEHRAAIYSRAAELRAQGVDVDQASRQAVKSVLDESGAKLAEVESAMVEGRTLHHPPDAQAAEPAAPLFRDDLMLPTGEFDAETGAPKMASANEMIAQARADAARIKTTAPRLMETAATCLLGSL